MPVQPASHATEETDQHRDPKVERQRAQPSSKRRQEGVACAGTGWGGGGSEPHAAAATGALVSATNLETSRWRSGRARRALPPSRRQGCVARSPLPATSLRDGPASQAQCGRPPPGRPPPARVWPAIGPGEAPAARIQRRVKRGSFIDGAQWPRAATFGMPSASRMVSKRDASTLLEASRTTAEAATSLAHARKTVDSASCNNSGRRVSGCALCETRAVALCVPHSCRCRARPRARSPRTCARRHRAGRPP